VSVNATGLNALRTGRPYPNGRAFADDVHELTNAKCTYTEGGRKILAVMWKDSKRYAATGG
jgi:hypothetical protein